MTEVICDYCNRPAKLVTGKEIYPNRTDLKKIKIWSCEPCDAYVGTHKNTKDHKPLGRLANATLRSAKQKAHKEFDPLWKYGYMERKEAYRLLAEHLKIDGKDCHIGMFDVLTCQVVANWAQWKVHEIQVDM